MKEPEEHHKEVLRQQTLEFSGLVGTQAERRFDVITESAKETMGVPIVLVSLVTKDTQWFKSAQGIAAAETPRCISFCGHAILQKEEEKQVFEVEDASQHPHFSDNPLVTGPPNIRFYAGMPVYAENSLPLGTLCLIDTKPRKLSALEKRRLKGLASWLEVELRNRGLSEEDLFVLENEREDGAESWLNPATKCWNDGAGKLLLARFLENAEANKDSLIALAAELRRPASGLTDKQRDELMLDLANGLRKALPEGSLLFHLGGDQICAFIRQPAGSLLQFTIEAWLGGSRPTVFQDPRHPLGATVASAYTQVQLVNGRRKSALLHVLSDHLANVADGESMEFQDKAEQA